MFIYLFFRCHLRFHCLFCTSDTRGITVQVILQTKLLAAFFGILFQDVDFSNANEREQTSLYLQINIFSGRFYMFDFNFEGVII